MDSDSAKEVVVLGAHGQLGVSLCREAKSRGYNVVTGARRPGADLQVDLGDLSSFAQIFKRPVGILLVAAGYTHVEQAEVEPELADRINHIATAKLAVLAQKYNCRVVFFSTDYVFDGRTGLYTEDDSPNPLSVYGRTKFLGERALLTTSNENLVIRTTWLWGPDVQRKNFVYQLLRAAQENRQIPVPTDQFSNPTYHPDLAKITFELLHHRARGVFHVGGHDYVSRSVFANRVCETFGLDPAKCIRETTTAELAMKARRPLRSGFLHAKLKLKIDQFPCGLNESLRAFRDIYQNETISP